MDLIRQESNKYNNSINIYRMVDILSPNSMIQMLEAFPKKQEEQDLMKNVYN